MFSQKKNYLKPLAVGTKMKKKSTIFGMNKPINNNSYMDLNNQ